MRNPFVTSTALLLAGIGFVPAMSSAQTPDAEELLQFLPEETGPFALEQVEVHDEAAFVKADYIYEPLQASIRYLLAYGDDVELLREHTSVTYSAANFTYYTDISELREMIDDRSERTEIENALREGTRAKMLAWEREHGTLVEEHPMIELFPAEAGPFVMTGTSQPHSRRLNVSYLHTEQEQSLRARIWRGERARQHYELEKCDWDEDNAFTVDGQTFHGTGHPVDMRAEARIDDYFLWLSLEDDTEDRVTEQMQQQLKAFIERFDTGRLTEWQAPEGDAPIAELSEELVAGLVPQHTEHFTLQDIHTSDQAMHARAEYHYEPEEHKVVLHLAYLKDSDRLAGRYARNAGEFWIAVEPRCLTENMDWDWQTTQDRFSQLLEPVNEQELAEWTLRHGNLHEVNPLARYFPAELGPFSIASLNQDEEEPSVHARYQAAELDEPIRLSATYGDEAVRQFHQYHLRFFEEDLEELEINGAAFDVHASDTDITAFAFFDSLLVRAEYEQSEPGDPEAQRHRFMELLSEFEPGRIATEELAAEFQVNFDGTVDGKTFCLDPGCFDEHLTTCEPARFGGDIGPRLGANYEIEGPAGDDHCRLSFQYTRNPNEDWQEQPLYFHMDRQAGFKDAIQGIIDDCLQGDTEAHACEGPLLDVVEQ